MADSEKPTASKTYVLVGPIGVGACNRAIKRLRKLQGLIRHRERWGYDLPFAPPLESLLPSGTPKEHEHEVIEREIAGLLHRVFRDLEVVGIDPVFTYESLELDWEKMKERPKEREWNVILDYFSLPHTSNAAMYRAVMEVLEGGIGIHEDLLERAKTRRWSPLFWIAQVVRAPLTVLDYAGLTDEETRSSVVKAYGWVVRIAFLLLLAFAFAKLGLSIHWTKLLELVK